MPLEVSDDHRLNIDITSTIVESHVIEEHAERTIIIELPIEVDFGQIQRERSPHQSPLELGDTTPLARVFEKLLAKMSHHRSLSL